MPAPPVSLSNDLIRRALRPYQFEVTDRLAAAVRCYIEILLFWNQNVNMTAVTNPAEILSRHFGESMFAAAAVPLQKGRLADVGSGAGFPGLALKLVAPELHLLLIESNAKKAAFLAEVVRRLELSSVEIMRQRYEELQQKAPDLDFVTARALGDFDRLLNWSRRSMGPEGFVILWLGSEDAATVSSMAGWKWRQQIPIPGSKKRVLLIGNPASS